MVSIRDVVRSGDRLAAMPASVVRVSAMLAKGELDTEALASIIRTDEVLSAAVLRRANSVRFGAAERTFDLRQSIVRLGIRNLSHVVMEQSAMGMFSGSGAAFGLLRGALWRSAVGGAIAAEMTAQRVSPADAGMCYMAGLLRDIGKVALEAYFGEQYFGLLGPMADGSRTFVECEREALGFDHAMVGAEMAAAWGLPERLCRAVRFHHEPPPDGEDQDIANDIVHAADVVCLWAGLAVGHDGMAYRIAPQVRDRIGLTRQEAELEIARVWTAVKEIEQTLSAPPAQERSA